MSTYGDILTVDLTTQRVSRQPLAESVVRQYLGGRGLNTWHMLGAADATIDPLDPRSDLLLSVGLLTGSLAPASARAQFAARSPQTGLLGTSNVGGHFGAALRQSGIAMLRITGRAQTPVSVWIEDGEVAIHAAAHLWGLEVPQTVEGLRAQAASDVELRALAIGPAGENLVTFACVLSENMHAAGRTGMGAVMGAKNLKALVVARSERERGAAGDLSDLARQYAREIRAAGRYDVYSTTGNSVYMVESNEMGLLGTRNFREVQFEGVEAINGDKLLSYVTRYKSCHRCPVHCKAEVRIEHGRFEMMLGERPDIEPLMGFGPRIGVNDPEAILYLFNMTNRFGLDVMSAAGVLAFAMDLYEREILSLQDTGGLPLRWGNVEAAIVLLEQIARREGLGDLLAEGVREAAQRIGDGAERYAFHSKGLDFPGYDPRSAQGTALAYAISNRGADYTSVYPSLEYFWTPEQGKAAFGDEASVDPLRSKGKGRMVRYAYQVSSVLDALGVCKVPILSVMGDFSLEPEARLVSAYTGWDITPDDLFAIGAEIITAERRINLRYGLTRQDDTLPAKFLEDGAPSGPAEGKVVDLARMVAEYYEAMGWDENGVPPD